MSQYEETPIEDPTEGKLQFVPKNTPRPFYGRKGSYNPELERKVHEARRVVSLYQQGKKRKKYLRKYNLEERKQVCAVTTNKLEADVILYAKIKSRLSWKEILFRGLGLPPRHEWADPTQSKGVKERVLWETLNMQREKRSEGDAEAAGESL